MQKKVRKSQGFTIIEVLIVLAIAGLIMVVVFLAVPSLQRAGRNNAASTNANNLLTGIGTYAANNGGVVPGYVTSAPDSSGKVTIQATSTASSNENTEAVKMDSGATNVSIVKFASIPTITPGVYVVVTGATCNATNTAAVSSTSGRAYIVLYGAESGTGNIVKCVGS